LTKLQLFYELTIKQIFLFRPLVGWWVGRAEKWRSPFWGVGLAVRCERSEHGKSQLFIKYFCTILTTFYYFSSFFNNRYGVQLRSFLACKMHCASHRLQLTSKGLPQAGVSQRLGREPKMLFRTAARTSCAPACGKPKLHAGIHLSGFFYLLYFSEKSSGIRIQSPPLIVSSLDIPTKPTFERFLPLYFA